MKLEFQHERENEHVEVKLGSRSVRLFEQSELDSLIREAVVAMRSLAASGNLHEWAMDFSRLPRMQS